MLGIELTPDEQLLKESVERFIERDYPFERRRESARSEMGFRPDVWLTFAELGWLGLSLPESAGGFGGGARQTAIVMEAFGGGLVTEPYLASVVMAGAAVSIAGSKEQTESLLAGVVTERWSQLFRQFFSVISGSLPPLVKPPLVCVAG